LVPDDGSGRTGRTLPDYELSQLVLSVRGNGGAQGRKKAAMYRYLGQFLWRPASAERRF
jgi:hypothetical protein